MSIYIWSTEIKNIYLWTTPVKEVFLGDTKVRPSGWQPWANTIAYYPLISDIKDYSWNWHNGTIIWNSGSFETIWWKQAYKFWYSWWGSSSGMDTRIDTWVQISTLPITLVARYYWLGGSDRQTIISNSSWNNSRCYAIRNWVPRIYIDNGTGSDRNTGQNLSTGVWSNIIAVIQSGATQLYINWQLKNSNSSWTNYSTNNTFKIGYLWLQDTAIWYYHYWWNGYLADVILEDKARTAEEVADYYNQTKGNYGL